jgi:ADP-ribose pyrophosphatase YjhB (NUDIX family)
MDTLSIARELQALAQTGLHYTEGHYDRERYARIREIAAEILAANSTTPAAEILRWNSAEFGYATPKVDVRGFVMREGRVLLISEAADGGRWTLPGGWADVNESPAESAAREVWEETGYTCRVARLLAVYDREKQGHQPRFPFHAYKLFFHCELTGGAPQTGHETLAVDFFPPDALPELSVSRVTAAQIQRFAAKLATGDVTTDFD